MKKRIVASSHPFGFYLEAVISEGCRVVVSHFSTSLEPSIFVNLLV